MQCPIPQKQNDPKQLDRLAAQRYLYAQAKTVHGWQIALATCFPVLWTFLIFKAPSVMVYGALWGVVMAAADPLLFTPFQKSLRAKAAKVQELFDCDVLELPWKELKAGRRYEAETIMESAAAFKCKDPECSTLRNWYPPAVSALVPSKARLVCQRASCWWDAKLRRRYAVSALVAMTVFALSVLLVQLAAGTTVQELILSGVAPLAPLFILVIKHYRDQNEAAEKSFKLKTHAEALWEKLRAGKSTEEESLLASRELQDEIYDHRRSSISIFDWFTNFSATRSRNKWVQELQI